MIQTPFNVDSFQTERLRRARQTKTLNFRARQTINNSDKQFLCKERRKTETKPRKSENMHRAGW